jgi:hypothetical protein
MFGIAGPYRVAWAFGRGESTVKYWVGPKFREAQIANDARRRRERMAEHGNS